jgi:predicted phage terminase large subunit-like protein
MSSSDRVALNALLRTSFPYFLRRCFLELNPAAMFLENWHIDAIAYHLELARIGKSRRLIVNVPPRSLKSTICSVAFPAYVLGRDPTKRFIVASYGSELATKLGNDFRTILQSDWYRSAFPGTRISPIKNSEAEVTTTHHGGRLAASVGGTLTGRGAGFVIIDDPLKPLDAYSDIKRAAANDWFFNTLLSRLDDKRSGVIVAVMQRLHADDLTAKLQQTSDEWTVLNLPAIAEKDEQIQIGENTYYFRKDGDLLHPVREPREVLDSLLAQMGADTFAAQYQQNPVVAGGNMIKRGWVQHYDNMPIRSPSTHVLQSYDTASKEGGQNDWSVCTTWYVISGKYYLVDVLRGRFDYPTLKERAIDNARSHRATSILIEDTGVGTALVQELRNFGWPAIAVKADQNKLVRMSIQSAKFQSRLVLFPRSATWLDALEAELFAFPGGRHDDQVDSISQALGHEIKESLWTAKSLEGYSNFVEGMAMDSYLGRLMGRPW